MENPGDRVATAPEWLPEELLERLRAFRESRVLLSAIELDVYTAVGSGATAPEVASRMGADPRATEMLLNALVALGMLAKQAGVFSNSPLTERYLAAGSPQDARAALMHTVHLWDRWSTLTECVRTGTSVTYREPHEREEKWTVAFIAAMHANAVLRAPELVRAVGLEGVNRMLDVGGGSGAYAIAFAQARPGLQVEVLDLAPVVRIAENHIAQAGLTGRVKTRVGDLRTDTFGQGYDLILLSAICHMLGPAENLDLLERCRNALAPGGRLVIKDFILDAGKTAPREAALFALNMLVGTPQGSTYSEPEYAAWLAAAGFAEVRRIRLDWLADLMVAVRRCS